MRGFDSLSGLHPILTDALISIKRYYGVVKSFLIGVLFLGIFSITGMFVLVWPNTYLSQLNVSFWPKPLLKMFLENKYQGSVELLIDGEKRTVGYADMGVTIDIDKTMEGFKTVSVTDLINKWVFSPSRMTLLQPIFIFSEDFEKIAIDKLPKKDVSNEKIVFDKDKGVFDYSVGQRKMKVDTVDLQVKLVTISKLRSEPIEVEMVSESDDLEKRVAQVNSNLERVRSKPIELIIGEANRRVVINPKEILDFLIVETKDLFNTVNVSVSKEKISKILADNGVTKVSADLTIKTISDNLTARYNNEAPRPIVLGADTGPNTDGTIAKQYIEVDISQQKMYFFENGQLFKAYDVSTGLKYPTPVGNYKIKNKLPMGFSGIFNVWMPWWMAFEYRDDIGAYLGIHELPYRLVDGQKVYRFGNYIGSKKTGGCVALAPGDSKEVYDKSYEGMDVLVFP